MKIKISGVLNGPMTESLVGSEIRLVSKMTTESVVTLSDSSCFVGVDGKYSFDVYPGRYSVYIRYSTQ